MVRIATFVFGIFLCFSASAQTLPIPYRGAYITSGGQVPGISYDAYGYDGRPGLPHLTGGWATPAERGDDRLYQRNDATGVLTPIAWTNPGWTPGYMPSYHSNDPFVVAPVGAPVGQLLLYFTCLPDQYSTFPAANWHNHVCWATSANGGVTWTGQGEAVGQFNGIDDTGAWAPSVVDMGPNAPATGRYLLFYHTSSTNPDNGLPLIATDRVTVLAADGHTPAGSFVLQSRTGAISLQLANLDVTWTDGQLLVIGQTGPGSVVAYVSSDIVHWYPWDEDPSGPAGSSGVLPVPPGVTPRWQQNGQITLTQEIPGGAPACPAGWDSCTALTAWDMEFVR